MGEEGAFGVVLGEVQGASLPSICTPSDRTHSPLAVKKVDTGVAIPIASILFRDAAAGEVDGIAMPTWLSKDSVDDRMNVWVSVSMSMERLQVRNTDVLALLRGYAYSHGLTVDQVASLSTGKGLQPEELLA